jgi:hypothetical protein
MTRASKWTERPARRLATRTWLPARSRSPSSRSTSNLIGAHLAIASGSVSSARTSNGEAEMVVRERDVYVVHPDSRRLCWSSARSVDRTSNRVAADVGLCHKPQLGQTRIDQVPSHA